MNLYWVSLLIQGENKNKSIVFKEDISECLNSFGKITSRYNIHINLKVDGEIEF